MARVSPLESEKIREKIAACATLSSKLKCGGVANRSPILVAGVETRAFFAVIYDQTTFEFFGHVTWGDGGFGFNLTLKADGTPSVRPFNTGSRHAGDAERLQALAGFYVHWAKMLLKKDQKKKGGGGGNFQEPLLKALHKSSSVTDVNKLQIQRFEETYVFDSQFAEFLRFHEKNGLRCTGSKKKRRPSLS